MSKVRTDSKSVTFDGSIDLLRVAYPEAVTDMLKLVEGIKKYWTEVAFTCETTPLNDRFTMSLLFVKEILTTLAAVRFWLNEEYDTDLLKIDKLLYIT